ncbi:hypothetical protein D3C85_13500 [compost metagenome]
MPSINDQVAATRLRVAKNYMLLISAGVDETTASEIIKKFTNLTFSEVRYTDDKVVLHYETCTAKRSVDFSVAA